MKNIEEKILMADEEIKQLQNKRKKLISQQKQEESKEEANLKIQKIIESREESEVENIEKEDEETGIEE